ncbi:MAG TPA: GNAT family N-acetyltransferase [Chitinophagaceae bacterium]|jgi:ribosomal-protein-alanine N-acetyltransferase|nr:GNAT family N-acetyltransferase [Chitinophagaceae bacterium]
MVVFETPRLSVSRFGLEHLEEVYLLNSNAEVMRYIRPVKNREECVLFLREILVAYQMQPRYGRWRVTEKESGAFAGTFALIPYHPGSRIQLGYALLPPFWGRGYATELTAAGAAYFFQTSGAPFLEAYTEPANLPSQHVLRKCGFHPEGLVRDAAKELMRFVLLAG